MDKLITKEEAEVEFKRNHENKKIKDVIFSTIMRRITYILSSLVQVERNQNFESVLENNLRYLYHMDTLLSRCMSYAKFLEDCSKFPRYKNDIDEMLKLMNEIGEPKGWNDYMRNKLEKERKMSEKMEQVFNAIRNERAYQTKLWMESASEGKHSTEEFALYIQDYLQEAIHIMSREPTPKASIKGLHIMRKIAAMAIACMEQNGIYERCIKDLETAKERHNF